MTIYTCDPNLEIPGRAAHHLLESINRDNYLPILEQHGLADINEDSWYRLQDLLNVFNDMNERGGTMMDFVSIGMAAGSNSILPPEMRDVPLNKFLPAYAQYYQQLHRNGDAGEIRVETQADNHVVLTIDVPYPDDLMYGLFYSYARRFARPDMHFMVRYDDELTRRDSGGEYTVIHVTWGIQ
jgi:hypothetical protein